MSMNRANFAEAAAFEVPEPTFETLVEPGVLYNGRPLVMEKTGYVGEGAGWDNPDGITVTVQHGLFVRAQDWRDFAANLCREAYEQGLDVTVVAVRDPKYHLVEDYAATSVEAKQWISKWAAEGHRIYDVGYSKGGEVAVMGAEALEGTGILRGVCTLATPEAPVELKPKAIIGGLTREAATLHEWGDKASADQIAQLAVSVASHIAWRALTDRRGTTKEIASIQQHANAEPIARLSQIPGFRTLVVKYGGDGLVLVERSLEALSAAEYGRAVLTLAGCHLTPLADRETRAAVLQFVAQDSRPIEPELTPPYLQPQALKPLKQADLELAAGF